jgi:hypothetical protein
VAAETLAQLLLALALDRGHPGNSPYSYEAVDECGRDPQVPACVLEPACSQNVPRCRAPRWSAVRRAWVQMESRASAEHRFAKVAQALARTSERLAACENESGGYCRGVGWTGSERQLALAGLTVILHESGLREDVMFGYPPLGRGPRGEACLMQVAPDQAARVAPWLGPEARDAALTRPKEREALARQLLGDSPEALERCFEVGLRLLASARRSCEHSGAWDIGMFAMYGTGASCRAPGVAERRGKTYQALQSARPAPLRDDLRSLLEDGEK